MRTSSLLLLTALTAAIPAPAGELPLAAEGKTGYIVVVPPKATPADHFAVAELIAFLNKSTGADFRPGHYEYFSRRIFVGLGEGTQPALGNDPLAGFAPEEHAVKTIGNDLYLYGQGQFGNLWAVYDFLEGELGCRFYSSFDPPAVPEHRRFALGAIDRRTKLALPIRAVHNYQFRSRPEANGLLFLLRNKINWDLLGDFPGGLKQANINPGYEELPLIGAWVHTLFYYIPPAPTPKPSNGPYQDWLHGRAYFDTHPEFFSQNENGKRVANRQLCFGNPALRGELTGNIEETIRRSGTNRGIVSVEAADTPGAFCCCPECKKLEEKYQSPGGPLFDYVLELASLLKNKSPEVCVKTLIYRRAQTQAAPAGVRFPDNVILIFAPVEDNFAADWTEATVWPDYHDGHNRQNAETYEQLKQWCQLAKHVWVWYYPNTYDGRYGAMGNVDRLVTDIRLLHQAGVSGAWFEHDVDVNCDFGFTDLQSYLMVKLVQNPDFDAEKLIAEFLRLKYGLAAPLMRRYLADLERATRSAKQNVPCGSYLAQTVRFTSAEDAWGWQQLFDEAERAVADEPAHVAALRRTRIYLDITTLFTWRRNAARHPEYFQDPRQVAQRAKQAAAGRKEPELVIDTLYLTASSPGKPLPEPLTHLAPERIVQVVPDYGAYVSRDKVPDPEAAFGIATETVHEDPFHFGYYDFAEKRGPRKTIELQDITPDRYQLYPLGQVQLTPRSLVWLSAHSWMVGYNGEFLYRPGEDNQWEVYVSLKFEGPLYSKSSKADRNRILCDRIVFVRPDRS